MLAAIHISYCEISCETKLVWLNMETPSGRKLRPLVVGARKSGTDMRVATTISKPSTTAETAVAASCARILSASRFSGDTALLLICP